MKRVAVLDPGRCKCGLVLADLELGLVREGHVLTPDAVEAWLEQWNQDQPLDRILIGDGTGSRAWIKQLERLGSLTVIPEQGTTLRARQRYWTLWPARGWDSGCNAPRASLARCCSNTSDFSSAGFCTSRVSAGRLEGYPWR